MKSITFAIAFIIIGGATLLTFPGCRKKDASVIEPQKPQAIHLVKRYNPASENQEETYTWGAGNELKSFDLKSANQHYELIWQNHLPIKCYLYRDSQLISCTEWGNFQGIHATTAKEWVKRPNGTALDSIGSTMFFEYDANGHLTKATRNKYNRTRIMECKLDENGNPVYTKTTETGRADLVFSFSYDDKHNPYYNLPWYFLEPFGVSLLPPFTASPNNPIYPSSPSTFDYNTHGFPIKGGGYLYEYSKEE